MIFYFIGLAAAFAFGCFIGNAWCQIRGIGDDLLEIDLMDKNILETQAEAGNPGNPGSINWNKIPIFYPFGGGDKWN